MTTTTDHFEVFGEPATCDRGLMTVLAPSAITIPPSDLPAVELPDYEPTAADLLAIESWADEAIDSRIAAANTLAAFEARHRDLLRLRAELPTLALADELGDTTLERAA